LKKGFIENNNEIIMVSACLCGINCRYDGQSVHNSSIIEFLKGKFFIPVCPEQLGGLSTPRSRSFINKGNGLNVLTGKAKVITFQGKDVTKEFLLGAEQVLEIVRLVGSTKAVLKEKSPSCGINTIYHKEKLVKGCGVTTALLLKNNFSVISEEEF